MSSEESNQDLYLHYHHDFMLLKLTAKFTEVLNKQKEERAEKERQRIRLLNADPFDVEVQNKIAEEIRYCIS